MGKVYKNGIVSPKGFDMAAGEPVDQREIVESISDLTTIPHTYPGIEVKVVGEQYKEYKLIATPSALIENWIEVVPDYAQPAVQTTDTVLNNSNLPGTTTTEALNSLAFGATGTYDEIKAIRDGDRLTPGSRYTITDYQTKYYIEGSNSSGLKIYTRVNSVFGPGANGYLVFDDFHPLLQAGMIVTLEELPAGYVTGVTGPYVVGDTSTCKTNFSDFYYQMELPNWAADETLVGAQMSYSLPRYTTIADDTITNDANGRPVMIPGGIVNTDVHDGTDYMDHTAAENFPVPIETIVLVAATTNSFQPVGFSGTFLGDTVYYDMDLNEVINDNLEVIGTRPGSIFRRATNDRSFDLECDWRVQRYRRYLLSDADKLKFINENTPRNAAQGGTFEIGRSYRINQVGNALTEAEWVAVGATAPVTVGQRFTAIASGDRAPNAARNLSSAYSIIDVVDLAIGETYDILTQGTTDFTLIGSNEVINAPDITIGDVCKIVSVGDTDYTLIGSNNVIAATAITIGDICKIETVGDTDYTLIGSTDNVVGTIFTATGVGVGTGTVDIGNNVDSIFTATDVGVGTGTIDIGNNIGSRFVATGTDLGTGEVIYSSLVRHPTMGDSLFTSIYRDPAQDDGYYMAMVPEEAINTLDRWARKTTFNAEIAGPNNRAKDFTTIPMVAGNQPNSLSIDNCEFIGKWKNVIVDNLPGGVYSEKTFVASNGALEDIYIGSTLMMPTGGGLFGTNIKANDFFQFPSGVETCSLNTINAITPIFFSGGHGGCFINGSILAGSWQLTRTSNDSFSWLGFFNAGNINVADSAISTRVANPSFTGCNIDKSAIFLGGLQLDNNDNTISRRTAFSNVMMEKVVLRFLDFIRFNTFNEVGTETSNPDNPRGQFVWTIPGAVQQERLTFNKTTGGLISQTFDVNNDLVITSIAESDNR